MENIYGVEMNRVHVSPPPRTHVHLYNISIQHRGRDLTLSRPVYLDSSFNTTASSGISFREMWLYATHDCMALGGGRIWQHGNVPSLTHTTNHTHYICSAAAMFKRCVVVVAKL